MAAMKTAFILLLIAFAMVMVTVEAENVPACSEFCSKPDVDKIQCCKDQGYSGYSSCKTTVEMQCTAFILLLVAFAMVMVTVEAARVGPCDQVCSRIDAEKDECCRAHGYSGYSSCRYGQMQCY
ncbi:hypothetical protein PYW08_004252 [Mythimna loreyi]|uniref:Uncharacterized protein n=1 Tax=Mythimna loreyi TaxID=667449 RepID=A0ACC2QPD2_9NEOP|nr:hypothetical protein PYW08_004252 [Mythimna loreyi]